MHSTGTAHVHERRGSGGGDYKRENSVPINTREGEQNSVYYKTDCYLFDNTQETTTDYSQGIIATTYLQFQFCPLTHLVLQKVYHEFHHQLVDVLSDRDTHNSIVSKLHTRAVISQEVMVAQMSGSTSGSDRGSSLLTVLGLEDKPHKLRELIAAMMEEGKVRSLAEEMDALLMRKAKQGYVIQLHAIFFYILYLFFCGIMSVSLDYSYTIIIVMCVVRKTYVEI